MRQSCLFVLVSIIAVISPNMAKADNAVDADPFGPAMFILNTGRTGGWQFTVDATLQVTHLGLYDWSADGFLTSYPIGLWSGDGTLLDTVVMPGGAGGDLVNGFRYVESSGAILTPGQTYTIGYFASGIFGDDRMLHTAGFHEFHPLVHQMGSAVATGGAFPGLTMPTVPFSAGFEYWLGPSFQFQVVPGPATCIVLVLAGLSFRRRCR